MHLSCLSSKRWLSITLRWRQRLTAQLVCVCVCVSINSIQQNAVQWTFICWSHYAQLRSVVSLNSRCLRFIEIDNHRLDYKQHKYIVWIRVCFFTRFQACNFREMKIPNSLLIEYSILLKIELKKHALLPPNVIDFSEVLYLTSSTTL